MRVFLGGTCNGSTWRDELIPLLVQAGIEYFNPVVDEWDEDAQIKEMEEREYCDICLYTITPKMGGVYSVAEVVEDAIKRPEKTIFNVVSVDGQYVFNKDQIHSLVQVGRMVVAHGALFVSGSENVMSALGVIQEQQNRETMAVVKTLKNSDVSGAKKNVKDLQVVGAGDAFRLVSKAYSESEGWMKSTKAMPVPTGCLVQVTTQQRNPDGSYAVAEALTFAPGVALAGPGGDCKFVSM